MATTAGWWLTALENQQLAGVIMWVASETIYPVATLVLLGVRLARPEQQAPALGATNVRARLKETNMARKYRNVSSLLRAVHDYR